MTNIVNFAKAKLAGIQVKRTAKSGLEMMKACLLVMTAVVAGVVVTSIAIDLVLTWGVVILYLTVQIAAGLAVGSLAYAAATKLIETVWHKPAGTF